MNINIKPIVSISLFSISILIIGCNTSKKENNMSKYGEVIMAENLKIIDTIDFYEKESNLFFILKLKNNTDEIIKIDKSIKPFWIQQDKDALKYKLISPSYPDGVKDQYVYLKPRESEDFVYKVNEMYQFLEGELDYNLTYIDYLYDINNSGKIDPKYLTEINLRWRKEKGSDKGTLINTDFDSKIN